MNFKQVVDTDGSIFDVKVLTNGDIMLCGEWLCLQLQYDNFMTAIANGRFDVV